MGVLYGGNEAYANMAQVFNGVSAYSFLVFNLLCAPCFAAIGAIKREMNSAKWTWIALGWECGFAYAVSFVVYQLGSMFSGNGNIFGFILAVVVIAIFGWALFRKAKVVK